MKKPKPYKQVKIELTKKTKENIRKSLKEGQGSYIMVIGISDVIWKRIGGKKCKMK